MVHTKKKKERRVRFSTFYHRWKNLENRKKQMEQKAKCPKCGTLLEEDDCYDTAFYDDCAVRYIVGGCPKCGTAYQWTEHYNYAGVEGVTEC